MNLLFGLSRLTRIILFSDVLRILRGILEIKNALPVTGKAF